MSNFITNFRTKNEKIRILTATNKNGNSNQNKEQQRIKKNRTKNWIYLEENNLSYIRKKKTGKHRVENIEDGEREEFRLIEHLTNRLMYLSLYVPVCVSVSLCVCVCVCVLK